MPGHTNNYVLSRISCRPFWWESVFFDVQLVIFWTCCGIYSLFFFRSTIWILGFYTFWVNEFPIYSFHSWDTIFLLHSLSLSTFSLFSFSDRSNCTHGSSTISISLPFFALKNLLGSVLVFSWRFSGFHDSISKISKKSFCGLSTCLSFTTKWPFKVFSYVLTSSTRAIHLTNKKIPFILYEINLFLFKQQPLVGLWGWTIPDSTGVSPIFVDEAFFQETTLFRTKSILTAKKKYILKVGCRVRHFSTLTVGFRPPTTAYHLSGSEKSEKAKIRSLNFFQSLTKSPVAYSVPF